jgi:hypothetical protein
MHKENQQRQSDYSPLTNSRDVGLRLACHGHAGKGQVLSHVRFAWTRVRKRWSVLCRADAGASLDPNRESEYETNSPRSFRPRRSRGRSPPGAGASSPGHRGALMWPADRIRRSAASIKSGRTKVKSCRRSARCSVRPHRLAGNNETGLHERAFRLERNNRRKRT